MKNILAVYFENFFNSRVIVQKYNLQYQANFLIYGRTFYTVQIQDLKFLVVITKNDEKFNISQYTRQQEIMFTNEKMNVVFYFESVTYSQQEAFIKNHLSFMSSKGQVFIPFIGLLLKGKVSSEKELSSEKMMPATQKVFLEIIYSKEEELRCTELAMKLGLSKMSVIRGCEQLKAMGLIDMEIIGRIGFVRSKYKGLELYKKAKLKLINPVQETLLISEKELPENSVLAGESLLGKLTMLNPPQIKQYAIYKNTVNKKNLHSQNIRWSNTEGLVYLQLWKYEPELFFKNDYIDPISLACSLSDINDERVEGEVEDLLGEFEW